MLLDEANAAGMARVIETGSPRLLSEANLLEASIVVESRKGEAGKLWRSPRQRRSTGMAADPVCRGTG